MNAKSQERLLAPAVVDALRTAYARVKPFTSARRLWDRVLSDDDKLQFGWNLQTSYERLGTVRMWMETRHVSFTRAVVEVAHEIGFLDQPTYTWLLRKIGDELPQPGRPFWDVATGKLCLGKKVIRSVRVMSNPTNIHQILEKFQLQQWPPRVESPFGTDQEQLHQTLRSLNRGLEKIRFRAQESGEAVTWERL
jgi:hypothetical protein